MTGIFYGSTTGTTEAVAEDIAKQLGVASADVHNVADASADEADKYDLLVVGSSTWGCGELQDDRYSFLDALKAKDLTGKKVAISSGWPSTKATRAKPTNGWRHGADRLKTSSHERRGLQPLRFDETLHAPHL